MNEDIEQQLQNCMFGLVELADRKQRLQKLIFDLEHSVEGVHEGCLKLQNHINHLVDVKKSCEAQNDEWDAEWEDLLQKTLKEHSDLILEHTMFAVKLKSLQDKLDTLNKK